ncbi:hypothetical protein EPUS_08700 [Endocarpon pusillum Z07020]|uniref:Uncharacterized protein n=1 Tax=Endocarpon pusillum (strain Z07020 / HMAS-L-300199) TaxID=1263415 RepID=U1G697_ENDPU|nr:uncharacterized protein EPUS_08700 [Endocarpon pusillum Z07020]ERF72892.1 hypothetical protein EPUS_08700 [Endocarpon pusillum Z07020]
MSLSRSFRWDGRGEPQPARVQIHDDRIIRESDLKWENDLRRMCRSSNVSWEVTDKVIQAHREKQEKKMRIRCGDASTEEIIIPQYEREHPVHREREVDREEIAIPRDQRNIRTYLREEIVIRRYEDDARTCREREPVIRRDGHHDRDDGLVEEVRVEKPFRSSTTTVPRPPPPATGPEFINAPTIHQEAITHHRHIDHGFELALKTEEDPKEDHTADAHEGRDAYGDEQVVTIEGTSPSSSPSPSPTPAPEPHVIKAPAMHQEVIAHHRHIDLGDSKADRMVQLLETILHTLRDEVTVTPLNKSTGEADTKAGKSVEELQAAEQTTKAQKALPPSAKKK